MKIEEYLESLPQNIVSGEDVQLPNKSFRDIFDFVKLGENDIFYHLGCGDGTGIKIALDEYHVKKAVGIDNNSNKIKQAKNILKENNHSFELVYKDIQEKEPIKHPIDYVLLCLRKCRKMGLIASGNLRAAFFAN